MQDLQAKLEKLRVEAEDCRLIAKLAPDAKKRAYFAKLTTQLEALSQDIEGVIAARTKLNACMANDDAPQKPPNLDQTHRSAI